jgi:AcrR family transcriptional regulator
MATVIEPAEPARLPLSRDRVLAAAVDLANAHGLEALSMRRLAKVLGVEAMSLYNHVANKDDLLDGIVDIAIGEIEAPQPGDEWKSAMRRRAISAREMLTRHPWAAGLFESRTTPSPIRGRYAEAVIGCLREAGFSVPMAVHAFNALDSYIYGFALQERSMPFGTLADIPGAVDGLVRAIPADEFPYLAETAATLVGSGYVYADEFEFGLDLILDAFDQLRPRA